MPGGVKRKFKVTAASLKMRKVALPAGEMSALSQDAVLGDHDGEGMTCGGCIGSSSASHLSADQYDTDRAGLALLQDAVRCSQLGADQSETEGAAAAREAEVYRRAVKEDIEERPAQQETNRNLSNDKLEAAVEGDFAKQVPNVGLLNGQLVELTPKRCVSSAQVGAAATAGAEPTSHVAAPLSPHVSEIAVSDAAEKKLKTDLDEFKSTVKDLDLLAGLDEHSLMGEFNKLHSLMCAFEELAWRPLEKMWSSLQCSFRKLRKLDGARFDADECSQMSGLISRAGELELKWKSLVKKPPTKCKPAQVNKEELEGPWVHLKLFIPRSETTIEAFEMKWEATDVGGADASYQRIDSRSLWSEKVEGDDFHWCLRGLKPGTRYQIAYRAIAGEGCKKKTNVFSQPLTVCTRSDDLCDKYSDEGCEQLQRNPGHGTSGAQASSGLAAHEFPISELSGSDSDEDWEERQRDGGHAEEVSEGMGSCGGMELSSTSQEQRRTDGTASRLFDDMNVEGDLPVIIQRDVAVNAGERTAIPNTTVPGKGALLKAATYAFEQYYQWRCDAAPDKRELGVTRPVHDLCNAVRKALLVRFVANAVASSQGTPPFNDDQVAAMEIAMIFESSGQQSEISCAEHPGAHQTAKDSFKSSSIKNFDEYVQLHALASPTTQNCSAALHNMWTASDDLLQAVFEVTHVLDLMRCEGDVSRLPKFENHERRLGRDFAPLAELASDAIIATGDSLEFTKHSCLHAPRKLDEEKIVLCSTDPRICITVVRKAHALRKQVRRKLSEAFPNLEKMQRRLEGETMQACIEDLASEIRYDSSGKWAKSPDNIPAEWLSETLGAVQMKVLDNMTMNDKSAALVNTDGSVSLKALHNKLEELEQDTPEDAAALQFAKAKLIAHQGLMEQTLVNGQPSTAWKNLVMRVGHSDWGAHKPGEKGFNKFAQQMFDKHGIPDTRTIVAPGVLKAPIVQPYQQIPAYLVHPKSYSLGGIDCDGYKYSQIKCGPTDPSQRLLVVHRTGAGKTCTMVRIADNYFNDKRPKLLLFPSAAVCSNFYMELLNPRFPNRYADFLQREGKLGEVRKNLELRKGGLMCGRVRPEFLNDDLRPSAPLRAFSYTQAGGRQSCGEQHRINAVFKCPDGYAGEWNYGPGKGKKDADSEFTDGYEEYLSDGNPFSNKIILMDEVHNLVKPSHAITKNPTRLLMLDMLKEMLRTCKNSVLVGFTATPLVDADGTARSLLDIIKGAGNEKHTDEGYISYFMGSPSPAFPAVSPSLDWVTSRAVHSASASSKQPNHWCDNVVRKVVLKNFNDNERGNLTEYKNASNEKRYTPRAIQRCSIGQHFATAGRVDVFKVLVGEGTVGQRKLCGKSFPTQDVDPKLGYCRDRVEGFSSKLAAVCDDVDNDLKLVVLVHSEHGFKLIIRLLQARFSGQVAAYHGGPPSSTSRWDDELKALLGDKHSEVLKARDECPCNICRFNNPSNLRGQDVRIMVADAKFCSEGVSFFGVRELLLVDLPEHAAELLQRCGRAIRFNGHAGLPADESRVRIKLYVATLPPPGEHGDGASSNINAEEDGEHQAPLASDTINETEPTADEQRCQELLTHLEDYSRKMRDIQMQAVDFNVDEQMPLWDETGGSCLNEAELEEEAREEAKLCELAHNQMLEMPRGSIKQDAPQPVESLTQRSFKTSRFRELKRQMEDELLTVSSLWVAVRTMVTHFANEYASNDFCEALRQCIDLYCSKEGYDMQNDVAVVAQRMWTSGLKANDRELCSILNHYLRDDGASSVHCFKAAIVLTKGINLSIVALNENGTRNTPANHIKQWPNGPNVTLSQGKSDQKNVTWRGGAMPRQHFQEYVKLHGESEEARQFRTPMFVATSFHRSVADDFAARADEDAGGDHGKVIFRYTFPTDAEGKPNCKHVNFIAHTNYAQEREFLLPPYTAMKLIQLRQSRTPQEIPHEVWVEVADDNLTWDLTLPIVTRM